VGCAKRTPPHPHQIRLSKRFFFEKKKQKLSLLRALAPPPRNPTTNESFLLPQAGSLFLKKEALPFSYLFTSN
jgi:hypothetical protein